VTDCSEFWEEFFSIKCKTPQNAVERLLFSRFVAFNNFSKKSKFWNSTGLKNDYLL
jgi:hypothetical protein